MLRPAKIECPGYEPSYGGGTECRRRILEYQARKHNSNRPVELARSQEERHIIVLRCEDVPLRGLLADNVYQDLVGIEDPEERRRRIIAAAERQSQAAPPPPRPFIGVPLRIASFTDRADELDQADDAAGGHSCARI